MQNNFKPIPRQEDLVIQELNGEVLIYDLKKNKAFCLNETSSLVWQACNGEKNVSEISRELSLKLNSPANDDLVWLALDQLKEEKLISNGAEMAATFDGLPRREVIKRVGLAAVVALPLVSSLVAPKAAAAQSVAAACDTQTAGDTAPGSACPPNCAGVACNTTTGQGAPGTCVANMGSTTTSTCT